MLCLPTLLRGEKRGMMLLTKNKMKIEARVKSKLLKRRQRERVRSSRKMRKKLKMT